MCGSPGLVQGFQLLSSQPLLALPPHFLRGRRQGKGSDYMIRLNHNFPEPKVPPGGEVTKEVTGGNRLTGSVAVNPNAARR